MKKVDTIDIVICIAILIGCALGFANMTAEWIFGLELIWLKLISGILIGLSSCSLMCWFTTDTLAKIVNNHRVKKAMNKEKK